MLKIHQFLTNPELIAIHTLTKLSVGKFVTFESQVYQIKEIVRDQPSKYFRKHTYYEVRI